MNWTELRAWVKDVGAPVVMALFLAWLVVRLNDQARMDRGNEMTAHKAEIHEIVESFKACCLKQSGSRPATFEDPR